jgi:molybdenum cofactor cytidylyltransferase
MTAPGTSETGVSAVILAAGGSTRMGRPKLALSVRGESMIRRAARAALASRCREVIVVLGQHAEVYRPLLDGLHVRLVDNPDPGEGMGSSIRTGVGALAPDAGGVVILLADQPFVSAAAIDRLIETAAARGRRVVASSYHATVGPPAFFHREYFPALLALAGDRGARSVIQAASGQALVLPLDDAAATDVDSIDDLSLIGEQP